MNTTQLRQSQTLERLFALGFNAQEAMQLRRISMTLHRWSELECGDGNDYASWSIERDEATGKPFLCVYPHQGKSRRSPVADREAGALRRLAAIMEKHPSHIAYHQTDPRGCALYILKASDVADYEDVASVYTRGVGIGK